jgi:arginine decarboxylase
MRRKAASDHLMKPWTTRDSAELYNISGWSNRYFDINEAGHVILTAEATGTHDVDVKAVVDDVVRRGLSMPLLLRFPDILRSRVTQLHTTFQAKIDEYEYKGKYQAVLPIKVNQQRHVVEEVLAFGEPYGVGLEAGSKPELLIAIALMSQLKSRTIVCNGFKDRAYIETALLSKRIGLEPLVIIDRFEELEIIIEVARDLGLQPNIGVRCKLSTKGSGKWAESGGDRSKFGLTAAEIVRTVDILSEANMLDRLQALHFHIGSQVTNIRAIKEAVNEAVRVYIDLCRLGAPMGFIDVGGGLAVDYDGSRTNFHASKNYSLEEYAADIVHTVGSALDDHDLPHPTIISESGRALVAHHSALIFDVLGCTQEAVLPPKSEVQGELEHQLIEELREVYDTISQKNYLEAYHDAIQLKEDGLSLYRHGILNLRDRAQVEQLFWGTLRKIWRLTRELDYVPEDLDVLEKQMADTYYGNFSLFQSLPDSWAVDALFPVLPIHRLNEKPTRRGIIADLTCDSDGKIDAFIGLHDVKKALELHPFNVDQPYFLGVFLVGAYQEILGDLHNLFGDVNAVHIEADTNTSQGYTVGHVVKGDTIKDVLSYVWYDERTLMEQLRKSIEVALAKGKITFEQSAALVRHFERSLAGYTYLESPRLIEKLLSSIVPSPEPQP